MEGDEINGVYFLVKGQAGFVLPKFNDSCYILIDIGDHYGTYDFIPSKNERWEGGEHVVRKFTVQAIS